MSTVAIDGLDAVVRGVPGVVAVYQATAAPGLMHAATAVMRGGGRVVVSADGAEAFVSVGVASTAGARIVARAVQDAVRAAVAAATGASPRVRVRVAHVE